VNVGENQITPTWSGRRYLTFSHPTPRIEQMGSKVGKASVS